MSYHLMVPIHLDALFLQDDQIVIEAMADFTRLPYCDGKRDVNPDVAYISEEIVSQPFENQNLRLSKGIHLHWALPDALTKGAQSGEGTNFPAVPNRWLVTRRDKSNTTQQWIVESDYLFPEGQGDGLGSISFPLSGDKAKGQYQPFRYMGRTVPLVSWQPNDTTAEYLRPLTAVGYGNPSFAAFYPNCHSVFGFYDGEISNPADAAGLQYDVLGWYSNSGDDVLQSFITNFQAQYLKDNQKAPTNDDVREALEKEFQWTVSLDDGDTFPQSMLCYARLTFAQPNNAKAVLLESPTTTVANSGTEALSAYLAQSISSDSATKSVIEDQLEALHLASRLANRQLDVGPKFLEARHEKSFTAVSGGSLWTITAATQGSSAADANQAAAHREMEMPAELALALDELNGLQQKYDLALGEIEGRRRQLFSDWYKYMLCAYPPEDTRDDYPNIDEVKEFIESRVLAPLQEKIGATGELSLTSDATGVLAATSSAGDSLASRLAAAINAVRAVIGAANALLAAKTPRVEWSLRLVPGPRYWQPNEPVVLMTGPATQPTKRHGMDGRLRADGLLECRVLPPASDNITGQSPADITALEKGVNDFITANKDENITDFALCDWTEQPWNPFLMEWEVELFPASQSSNLNPESRDYSPDFITRNYSLEENAIDFTFATSTQKSASVYSGSSILTPHASIQLQDRIEKYFDECSDELLPGYYKANSIPEADQTPTYLTDHRNDVLKWYLSATCSGDTQSALCNIIRAYQKLIAPDFYSMSQTLSGFNEALLMRKQTMQLPIADPLGFDDYQAFAAAVRDAAQESIRSAPEPLDDFNPIRSGGLKLLRLRLVDTFGQSRDLDLSRVSTTDTMTAPSGDPYSILLPPRLAQAARLNFRWLAAGNLQQEMNAHPDTTPICGWVLPNNLDNSVMVYDNNGQALGSLSERNKWQSAPGSASAVDEIGKIPNPHLQKLIAWIAGQGQSFLQNFISALDSALENIEPESFAQHRDLALLMGSPLALVRASLDLQLLGSPAVNQGWNAFRQDLSRGFDQARDTDNLTAVRFPIRMGEYRQFNDGLVGYWKEAGESYENDFFYTPQSDNINDSHIKTHANDPMTFYQTLDAAPQVVTMLLDPRGSVHATCGILPVKSISLPPNKYAAALQAIEITFLSTPVLTDNDKMRLPLPNEGGYVWSWLQKEKQEWQEISAIGIVRKQAFADAFANIPVASPDHALTDTEAVWGRLKDKGWITEIDAIRATVVAKDQRASTDLGTDDIGKAMKNNVEIIEDIFDRTHITAPSLQAAFSRPQEIREGWLKLKHDSTDTSNSTKQTALS